VILAAILGQRRFAYYYAINVALLTGYFSVLIYYVIRLVIGYLKGERTDYMSWQTLGSPELKEEIVQPVKPPTRAERKRAKRRKGQEAGFHPSTAHVSITLCIIFLIFFLGLFPNTTLMDEAKQRGFSSGEAWWQTTLIGTAISTAGQARFAPNDAWMSSLSWLKENTPNPLSNPDSYYELHTSPFQYPESAYGVMAWWDYGYWITRIAHRIPNANPSQDPAHVTEVARFFTSQDEDSVSEIIQELGSEYIIIDYDTATSKFWAIATWAGKAQTEFFDVYYEPKNQQLVPRMLFYPEYYQSLSTRLYNFDGKAVVPDSSIVISFKEKVSREGKTYKEITSAREFGSYEDAEAYLSNQESADYRIVSDKPFVSPVPLEALKNYKLAYSSDIHMEKPYGGTVPAVKIFEYIE
jgi:asparagine N-glycosylation enzyme membrane subunit Stt3